MSLYIVRLLQSGRSAKSYGVTHHESEIWTQDFGVRS